MNRASLRSRALRHRVSNVPANFSSVTTLDAIEFGRNVVVAGQFHVTGGRGLRDQYAAEAMDRRVLERQYTGGARMPNLSPNEVRLECLSWGGGKAGRPRGLQMRLNARRPIPSKYSNSLKRINARMLDSNMPSPRCRSTLSSEQHGVGSDAAISPLMMVKLQRSLTRTRSAGAACTRKQEGGFNSGAVPVRSRVPIWSSARSSTTMRLISPVRIWLAATWQWTCNWLQRYQ